MEKHTSAQILEPLNDTERKYVPEYLFTSGHVEFLKESPRVAVVGTRTPSHDAIARTKALVQRLVAEKAIIISGLALGIDGVAHRAAIENSGRTIAVLGTPINKFATNANKSLQELIMRDHLAVSQFEPGRAVQKGFFPMRNRTMALICQASVIMEAADGSGTLSQGWEALRLGRPLFIAKQIVENQAIAWPAKMLQYGARVLDQVDEILEVLPSPDFSHIIEHAF